MDTAGLIAGIDEVPDYDVQEIREQERSCLYIQKLTWSMGLQALDGNYNLLCQETGTMHIGQEKKNLRHIQ